MLRALSCLLSLSACAFAQDPAARCAEALLRGDHEAAARAADEADNPPVRARLQAALAPLPQRPAAMLAVAAQFYDSPEADAAILAGAAAVLALRDRGRAVPGLMAWLEQEDDGGADIDLLALAPVIQGLWRQLEYRRQADGDAATLQESARLLQLCSVSRFGFDPARVRSAATWALPMQKEDLTLRAWRRQPGRSSWEEFDQLGPPQVELSLPQNGDTHAPGLPSGDWLVELASVAAHWRGLRAIEVSDLDVVAMVDRGALALGVWRGDQPAAAGSWRVRGLDSADQRGNFQGGVTVAWPELREPTEDRGGSELLLRSGGDGARLELPATREAGALGDPWQAHLMLDRPLYRPGETILGRIAVRHCRYDGSGVDAVAHTEPAADQAIRLRAFADDSAEVQIDGRTDAHGVFAFAVPVPQEVQRGSRQWKADLLVDGGLVHVLDDSRACQIADYHRAALLIDVAGPQVVRLGDADPKLTLHANWASGAPAAGLSVTVETRYWSYGTGTRREQHALTTDGDGNAVATIALQHLRPGWVNTTFTVATPDGSDSVHAHPLSVRGADESDAEAARPWWQRDREQLWLHGPDDCTVDTPCRVEVNGKANAHVLLVAGRGHGARAMQLQLDAKGHGSVAVTPTRAEWPWLDLAVASGTESDSRRIPVRLRAAAPPRIELPQQCRPGEAVTCAVATGTAGTVVTVAVVDERIFAIAEDPTREPEGQLLPWLPEPSWQAVATAPFLAPKDLLGSLLQDGRVAASGEGGELGSTTGQGGATFGPSGPASLLDLRTDFRATAAFVTAIASTDGVAVVPFTLPDDLTTWRVSIVGIAPDGVAFVERRALVARLPLAAEPLLPRVLRQGDRVAMPVAIDRAAAVVDGGEAAQLNVGSDSAALVVDGGDVRVPVPAGSARTAMVTLRAVAAGDAALAFAVALGEHGDRSRRTMPVQRDAVAFPLATVAAMGSGRVEVQLPAAADPQAGIDVVVLGGSGALWHAIERQLQDYPHGCVEQTLSRLLPFFAAVRGARAHGAPPPVADKKFQQRLVAGLHRLRELQDRRGGGFSFWPRGEVDPGMTALVLHGLSVMRDGGVDPAQYGLFCDPLREPFAAACQRLAAQRGAVATSADAMAAELAAACLRSVPEATAARLAVVALVDAGGALPPGLLARMGLALAAAGDRDRAARCLLRLDGMQLLAKLSPDGFPGEDPLAVQALRLELHCLLQPVDEVLGSLAGEVLLQCLHGNGTTYAQACALSALALALPPDTAQPFSVQVTAGAVERSVALTEEHGFTARLYLPFAERCAVVGPAGRQVLLRVDSARNERASDHAAWQTPITVVRELCRKRAGASPEQVARGDDLEPIGDAVPHVGEVLWLRVSVRAQVPMRYVVVDCPLPAGLELIEQPWWIERFDDRFAFTFDWLADKPAWRAFAVVPTMAGAMGWPPAVAAPMYVAGCDGGCAGSVLTVAAASAVAAGVAAVTCFLTPPPAPLPPPEPTSYVVICGATGALRAAFAGDPATQREQIEAAFATLAVQSAPDQNPEEVLSALTRLVGDLRRDFTDARSPVAPSRAALLARVDRQQQLVATAVLEDFEQETEGHLHDYRFEQLMPAFGAWTDTGAREAMLVRALQQAIALRLSLSQPRFDAIPGPVTTAALRSELLAVFPEVGRKERASILELLPAADLATFPPAALVAGLDKVWPAGIVKLLLGSATGRAELQRCLQQPTCLYYQFEQMAADLPDELWRQIPLAAYAELIGTSCMEDLFDGRGFDLPTRLADAAAPTAELQRELVTTRDVDWRLLLALALRQRGVRDLGAAAPALRSAAAMDPGEVPLLGWWQRALAVGTQDAAAALRLLLDLRLRGSSLAATSRELRRFVLQVLVAHGTPAQLAAVAEDLDESQCRVVFARLDAAARRELIAGISIPLPVLPDAHDVADGQVLWDFAARCGDRTMVLEALCHTDAGLAFLNAHIAGLDAEDRERAVAAYADALGLDPDTMQPPTEEPWLPALRAAVRNGIARNGTPAEQQQLEQLRRLRGVW